MSRPSPPPSARPARHHRPRKRRRPRPAHPPLPVWRRNAAAPALSHGSGRERRPAYRGMAARGGCRAYCPAPRGAGCAGVSAGCAVPAVRPCRPELRQQTVQSRSGVICIGGVFLQLLLSTRTMSVSPLLSLVERRRAERESCCSQSPTSSFAAEPRSLSWGIFFLRCG